jgi:hypothetical protein
MTYILFWTCVAPLPAPTRAAAALRHTRSGVVSSRLIRAFHSRRLSYNVVHLF